MTSATGSGTSSATIKRDKHDLHTHTTQAITKRASTVVVQLTLKHLNSLMHEQIGTGSPPANKTGYVESHWSEENR